MGVSIGSMPGEMMKDYMDHVTAGRKEKTEKAFGKTMDGLKRKSRAEAGRSEAKGPWEDREYAYDKSEAKTEGNGKLYGNLAVKKNSQTQDSTPQLSERAQKLLDELKEKYGNMDFFVQNVSSDEEADAVMSRGTKEYSVLIDPDTLEKMAADEEFKEQCISSLEESTGQIESMMEELGEDADKIESIGIKINSDGTTEFFAKLRESSDAQKQRIDEAREAKREEMRAKQYESVRRDDLDHLRKNINYSSIKFMQGPVRPDQEPEDMPGHIGKPGPAPFSHADFMRGHHPRPFDIPGQGEVIKADSMESLLEALRSRGIGVQKEEEAEEEAEAGIVEEAAAEGVTV